MNDIECWGLVMLDRGFFLKKRIFLTGHTGFKGAWLCRVLTQMGAQLTGYALEPPTTPNLFSLSGIEGQMDSVNGDIRDISRLMNAVVEATPRNSNPYGGTAHCSRII
jgi:CDP-glucose 4,6-dehydratase